MPLESADMYIFTRSERSATRLQELQAELDDFVANVESDLLEFPSTLSAHDRFLVHEVFAFQLFACWVIFHDSRNKVKHS